MEIDVNDKLLPDARGSSENFNADVMDAKYMMTERSISFH